jgi:hypothetical protein
MHQEKVSVQMKAEGGVVLHKPRNAEAARSQSPGTEQIPLHSPSENSSAYTLILNFWPPEL